VGNTFLHVLHVLGWLARALALVTLLAFTTGGGCDWFLDPEEANNRPGTPGMKSCPGGPVSEGEDVTIEWGSNGDVDGRVVGYRFEWALDDTVLAEGDAGDSSYTIESIEEGAHDFSVWAVDDDGDLSRSPAVCRFDVFESTEPGSLVGRVVLCEFVTGLGCPNCPDAREGLEIVLGEYGRDSLAVVAYYTEHHPLTSEEVLDQVEEYFGTPAPVGLPIVFVDHAYDEPLVGATTPEAAAERYRERIDERRTLKSPLTMRVTGGIARGEVTVTARVEYPLTGGPYVVRSMLVEDNIFLFNESHMFVVRDILEDEPLTVAAVGESAVIARDFTIDPGWVTDDMDVIAFVQDETTFEILQARRLRSE
jgi:hypothetical protein